MEEAKKIECYKRLIYKQFVQISGLIVAHNFRVISRNTFHAPLYIAQVAQAHYESPEQHYPTLLINYSYSKKIIRRCM